MAQAACSSQSIDRYIRVRNVVVKPNIRTNVSWYGILKKLGINGYTIKLNVLSFGGTEQRAILYLRHPDSNVIVAEHVQVVNKLQGYPYYSVPVVVSYHEVASELKTCLPTSVAATERTVVFSTPPAISMSASNSVTNYNVSKPATTDASKRTLSAYQKPLSVPSVMTSTSARSSLSSAPQPQTTVGNSRQLEREDASMTTEDESVTPKVKSVIVVPTTGHKKEKKPQENRSKASQKTPSHKTTSAKPAPVHQSAPTSYTDPPSSRSSAETYTQYRMPRSSSSRTDSSLNSSSTDLSDSSRSSHQHRYAPYSEHSRSQCFGSSSSGSSWSRHSYARSEPKLHVVGHTGSENNPVDYRHRSKNEKPEKTASRAEPSRSEHRSHIEVAASPLTAIIPLDPLPLSLDDRTTLMSPMLARARPLVSTNVDLSGGVPSNEAPLEEKELRKLSRRLPSPSRECLGDFVDLGAGLPEIEDKGDSEAHRTDAPAKKAQVICVVCRDEAPDILARPTYNTMKVLPCSHTFCARCVSWLTRTTTDSKPFAPGGAEIVVHKLKNGGEFEIDMLAHNLRQRLEKLFWIEEMGLDEHELEDNYLLTARKTKGQKKSDKRGRKEEEEMSKAFVNHMEAELMERWQSVPHCTILIAGGKKVKCPSCRYEHDVDRLIDLRLDVC